MNDNVVAPGEPILIWGGAGGLGSMAIQIAAAAGARPVAVVSGDSKNEFCKKLGAVGVINRKNFDHWGMLPHWTETVQYQTWVDGVRSFGSAIWNIVGEKKSPAIDRMSSSTFSRSLRKLPTAARPSMSTHRCRSAALLGAPIATCCRPRMRNGRSITGLAPCEPRRACAGRAAAR